MSVGLSERFVPASLLISLGGPNHFATLVCGGSRFAAAPCCSNLVLRPPPVLWRPVCSAPVCSGGLPPFLQRSAGRRPLLTKLAFFPDSPTFRVGKTAKLSNYFTPLAPVPDRRGSNRQNDPFFIRPEISPNCRLVTTTTFCGSVPCPKLRAGNPSPPCRVKGLRMRYFDALDLHKSRPHRLPFTFICLYLY